MSDPEHAEPERESDNNSCDFTCQSEPGHLWARYEDDAQAMYRGITDAYQLAGRAVLDPDATEADRIALLDHLAGLAETFQRHFSEDA